MIKYLLYKYMKLIIIFKNYQFVNINSNKNIDISFFIFVIVVGRIMKFLQGFFEICY